MEEQKHAIKDGKKSVLPEAIDIDDFNPEDGTKKPLGDATHAGDLGSLETSSESPDSSGEDEEEEKMCKALATAPRVTEGEWCSGGSSSAATDRQGARVDAAR